MGDCCTVKNFLDYLHSKSFDDYQEIIKLLTLYDTKVLSTSLTLQKLQNFQGKEDGINLSDSYLSPHNSNTTLQCINFVNKCTEIISQSEMDLFPIDLSDGAGSFACFPEITTQTMEALFLSTWHFYPQAQLSQQTVDCLSAWANLKGFSLLSHERNNFSLFCGGVTRACAEIFKLVNVNNIILIPTPSYGNLIPLAAKFAQVELLPLTTQTQWKLTPNILRETIQALNTRNPTSKVEMLLFLNPANPTGVVYSQEEINGLADVLVEENCLILEDIIHHDLEIKQGVNAGSFQASPASVLTITVFGPSKAYCAAGWRLGISYTKNDDYAEQIQKNLWLSEFAINKLYEKVATVCYQQSITNQEYLQKNKTEYQLRHALLKLFILGEENCHLVAEGKLLVSYVKKLFPEKASAFLMPAQGVHLLTDAEAGFFQLLGFSGWKNKFFGDLQLKTSLDIYQLLGAMGILTLPDLALGHYDEEHLSVRISISNSLAAALNIRTNPTIEQNIVAHYMLGCAIERIKTLEVQLI